MNIKTNLLENYVNFVDLKKKQKKIHKLNLIFSLVSSCLFLFFCFF